MIIKHQRNKLFRSFCTKSTTDKSYSGTVLLPKTKLPLRLEGKKLVVRDRLLSNVNFIVGSY